MDKLALLVRLQARKGKEADVEKFLQDAIEAVEKETGTSTWRGLKGKDGAYYIFDTFLHEEERQKHLSGAVAKTLKEKTTDLFAQPPVIEQLDIVAEKMPDVIQY